MLFQLKNNSIDERAIFAIAEAMKQLGHEISQESKNIISIKKREKGLLVRANNNMYEIEYSTLSSLMRAVGILCGHLQDSAFETEQIPQKELLSVMLDCSRNAMMNRERRFEFCRILAIMGYNAIMLYTEDTYQIKDYPYFGYQRAIISQEELRELDDYCDAIGLELIPCIQTLAHLNTFFYWPDSQKYRDCEDILLVNNEEVYKLIDAMLSSMSSSVRSRRINIGMDEAAMLGRGSYLSQNGYEKSADLMQQHLQRVKKLCAKYDYRPMMWSDMFFKLDPRYTWYYDERVHITEEIASIVPSDLTLVYWDYYGTDPGKYKHMFDEHCKFHNEIAFAGGASCWYGLIPLNHYSINSARVALSVAKDYPVKFLIVTMWGDDGAMCSPFSAMPTLQLYGEYFWGCDISDDALTCRLKECADADYSALMSMEDAQKIPTRQRFGRDALAPTRYMFYQDPLTGMFDKHVPIGSNAHFAERAEFYKQYTEGKWGYLFRPIQHLCKVLSRKSELGCLLKSAYDSKDKNALKRLADEIPYIITDVEMFYDTFREQWMHDNCRIGFEVQDIRIGALIFRLKQVREIVLSYVNGNIDRIEELEIERLKYREPKRENDIICYRVNSWAKMLTANLFSQSVYF